MLMVQAMLCGNESYLFSHPLPLVAWAHPSTMQCTYGAGREHRGNYFWSDSLRGWIRSSISPFGVIFMMITGSMVVTFELNRVARWFWQNPPLKDSVKRSYLSVFSAISVRDRKYNITDPFRVTIKPPLLGVVVNFRRFSKFTISCLINPRSQFD